MIYHLIYAIIVMYDFHFVFIYISLLKCFLNNVNLCRYLSYYFTVCEIILFELEEIIDSSK